MGVLGAMADPTRPMRPHEWRRPAQIDEEMATVASDQIGMAQYISNVLMSLTDRIEKQDARIAALEQEVTKFSNKR